MDFLLYEKGETFLLNNVTQRSLFVEATDKISFYDDIILTSKISFETGSVVNYQNFNWLIISQVQNNEDIDTSIYRARIRKCNYNVNFNFDGLIKVIPTIIEGKTFDIATGQYIILPASKILVTMQENPDTLAIAINQRFIKMGSPWKITGIDRTVKGLITLSADLDLWSAADDRILEIANKITYTVAFTDVPPVSVNIGATYQTNIAMVKDGVSITFPVTYTSSNANMSVSSTGLLTANVAGTSIITVTKADNPTVFTTLNVEAKVNSIPVVVNSILPQTLSMLQNETVAYTVYQYVDSVANTDLFTIVGSGPSPASTYYTLTVTDGNHFTVKNLYYTATKLLITCTNNREGSVVTILITLKGLY